MPEPSYEIAHAARKGPKIAMGKGMRKVEPGDPGTGRYSDRIKIKPQYQEAEPDTRQATDPEIQKIVSGRRTDI